VKKTQKKQPVKKKEVKEKPQTPKSLEMAVRLVRYFYKWPILHLPCCGHEKLFPFQLNLKIFSVEKRGFILDVP
jgi:hypothetical protein